MRTIRRTAGVAVRRLFHLPRVAVVLLPAVMTVVVTLLQLTVLPQPGAAPFLFYFAGVAVVASLAGIWPGLATTALSTVVANLVFLPPRWHPSLSQAELNATALFLVSASGVALLCAAFRRALMQAEARGAEARRLSEMLLLSHDAIVVWRLPGIIESWNHGAEEIYGYPAAEALGKSIHELLATRPSNAWDRILSILAEEGGWRGELIHRAQDGRSLTVSARLRMVRGSDDVERVLEVNRDITERLRVQEAQRRYELLAEHSRDIILFLRVADGHILEANRAATTAYGYTRDEMLALTVHNLRTGDPPEQVLWQLQQAAHAGARFETMHRRKDGSVFPVEVSSQGARMEGVPTIISVVRDISERRLAEQERERLVTRLSEFSAELQRSQRQLEAVFEAMHDGVVVLDMRGSAVMVNRAEAEMNGFRDADEMKRNLAYFAEVYELQTADGRVLSVDEWPASRVLRGEFVTDLELRGRRRDVGREWYFSFSGQPVRDEHGRQVLAVLITRDITERKQSEDALRSSEERFRALADAMPQLVWTANPDGRVDYYNRRYREMSGIQRPADADVWTWAPVLHPDDSAATTAAWGRAVRDGTPYEMAHRVRMADGQYRWYLSRGVPVRDEQGRVARWYGTATDIDAQKRAEDALRESDRRKNEFLAMLSHELRNPLAPIRNSIYILERATPGSEQAKRAHAVIDRQVRHMTRLVDDLLDVTRISRGKIRLRKERLNLGALLRRVVEDHRSVFAKNGIDLEAELPEGAIPIDGDGTRIAQVAGNLLQNAAKFTPRGGRTVLTLERDGTWAKIRVRDTGAGMAPRTIARLFEPFAQADTTLDRNPGGLGLGLALAKGMTELHGGHISANSAGLGLGSEFIVQLPLAREEPVRPAPPTAEPVTEAGRRVLVIEDNQDAADSLKEALELSGHVVEVAATGPEGIERARRFRPEVVLCDIGLPGIDGYEVARRMRADPDLRSVRLIALSGYAAPEDIDRSRLAGFEDHLAKPPSLEQLEHRLAHLAPSPEDTAAPPS